MAHADARLGPLARAGLALARPARHLGQDLPVRAHRPPEGQAVRQEVDLFVGLSGIVVNEEARGGVELHGTDRPGEQRLHVEADRVGAEGQGAEVLVLVGGLRQDDPEAPGHGGALAPALHEAELGAHRHVAEVGDAGLAGRAPRADSGHPLQVELHGVRGRVDQAQERPVPAGSLGPGDEARLGRDRFEAGLEDERAGGRGGRLLGPEWTGLGADGTGRGEDRREHAGRQRPSKARVAAHRPLIPAPGRRRNAEEVWTRERSGPGRGAASAPRPPPRSARLVSWK